MPSLSPNAGLLVTGEAMKTAFQAGYTLELARQAQALGWAHPFRVTVGSSSGSFAAVIGATEFLPDHDLGLKFCRQFAADLRPHVFWKGPLEGRWELPYRAALERILDGHDLIDWAAAFESPTMIVIVATHIDVARASENWSDRFRVLADGIQRALGGQEVSVREVAGRIAELSAAGASGFMTPCYLSTKPWPREAPSSEPANWHVLKDADELRQAVVASTRIPPFTGMPLRFRDLVLIDGAWSDNAPAWLAPALGLERFFIVDCTHKGKLYSRPIGDYLRRRARLVLEEASDALQRFEPWNRGGRLDILNHVLRGAHDLMPRPEPIDLTDLESRADGLRILEDHLPADAPNPYRFLAPRTGVVERLYEVGVETALARAADLLRPRVRG